MLSWLKLSHRDHSGRLRPHEYTSYFPLGLLLLVVGLSLVAYTAAATTPSPGPEAGSIGLSGSMPGKAPTVAAVIKSPTNQQRFGASPINVSGTCPASTLVEIFKNDIFAGSTTCSDSGTFSLEIDPLIGQNVLIARVYDALNQAGPDSNAVTIFYDALPTQAGALSVLNFGGDQLLLNTDAVFRGAFPEQEFNIPIDVIGGTAPYAINIQWGDSSNKVVPRNDNAGFKAGHTYQKAGIYQISLQATDAIGRVAFLTVASIVNGQPGTVSVGSTSASATNKLLVLWPLYTAAIGIMLSFWMGERREKYIIFKHNLSLPIHK